MRELKDELKQRLQKVKDERSQLSHRLDRLGQLEQAIDLLLNEEEEPITTMQLPAVAVKAAPAGKVIGHTELGQFLVKALSDGQPHSLVKLVQMAKNENFDFRDKAPKRVLHFALVGLQYNNYARMVEPSVWQLTGKAATAPQSPRTQ